MFIAAAQLNSVDSFDQNLQSISALVHEAAQRSPEQKPSIIFFPENSLYFRMDQSHSIPQMTLEHPVFETLKKSSQQSQISLHLTTALYHEGKTWNASILVNPNGTVSLVYKKIHLFDIQLKDQKPIRESDVFANGPSPYIMDVGGLKFGSSICYDVRFSELYSYYAKHEVDAILIPAAFLKKTGEAHWEILLRARAIESQAYVIAPAQAGIHRSTHGDFSRETYGHTMIVDPWGQIAVSKADGIGLIYAEINSERTQSVRMQIPMKKHRRL